MKRGAFDWESFEEACARRSNCAASGDVEGEAKAQSDMDRMSLAEAKRMQRRHQKDMAPLRALLRKAKSMIQNAGAKA